MYNTIVVIKRARRTTRESLPRHGGGVSSPPGLTRHRRRRSERPSTVYVGTLVPDESMFFHNAIYSPSGHTRSRFTIGRHDDRVPNRFPSIYS